MESYAKDNVASKTGAKTPLRCICITYTNSIQIVSLQLLAHPQDLAVLHQPISTVSANVNVVVYAATQSESATWKENVSVMPHVIVFVLKKFSRLSQKNREPWHKFPFFLHCFHSLADVLVSAAAAVSFSSFSIFSIDSSNFSVCAVMCCSFF